MSNLTSDRDTEFVAELERDQLPVKGGMKICNGAAVALGATGCAVSAGPNVKHLRGIADETVDNTDGNDGDETINVISPDAAYWDGSGFTQADVGAPVYFSDDHTVTKTAGTNCYAGRVRSVDQYGVLVDLRGAYAQAAIAATTALTAPHTAAHTAAH